jgi:fructose-1,6-bisphosphatase/inositol monophosphatase family enzyme
MPLESTAGESWNRARALLCRLHDTVRDAVVAARETTASDVLAEVAAVTAADTIYRIDKVGEEAILAWFGTHWPHEWPVELVMEGAEGGLTFPRGTPVSRTHFKCILDPIDGTRNLMYDKRSAWVLSALAPQRGTATTLADIVVAAMTELPTTKQWASDQISGVRGCGPEGLIAERADVRDGSRSGLKLRPSRAVDFRQGFASIARFFPEGKALLARVEEGLWEALYGLGRNTSPLVFDDQYMTTGGQVYELLVGHDRMLGDLRPLAHRRLGCESALVCHPYDICTSMLLQEAGGVVEDPWAAPLAVPLDTTSPVSWMGYANPRLADQVRPHLQRLIGELL